MNALHDWRIRYGLPNVCAACGAVRYTDGVPFYCPGPTRSEVLPMSGIERAPRKMSGGAA